MGSIKFNTNRTKVELTGITETESSTLSGKGKQTSILPTYKPNFKDVNLTTIQAQARTPVFKSVTTPRKYTTPTKKPKIELPDRDPFTQEEVMLLQHQSRIPMAMPKSDLRDKAAINTEYALKSNPSMYGRMEGFSPLATKKQVGKMLGQEIDTTGAEDTLGYKVGYGAGLMGQYMITGGIAHTGVRQGLTRMIPQLANQAGRSTVKNVLGTMGASALTDVLTGVPVNTLQAIKESTIGDNVNWNQFAKSFAVNTGIDIVFGGLIEGAIVLKSGKKIKTVGDLKTVTPDESKEITEQLMLNSPKYKENLMLNAPTNKLLNIPQKQLTQPVNYVDELGNISNDPNFNAAKNVLQEEPYVKNKIKVTVKRPSGIYEKFDDDWDFGWDSNDINSINDWIEFSKSHGRAPTKLLKSQLNKTQIEIDKAFDEAKDYFLNYQGKGVDLVEMVDLPGRKVRESLNDEWYRRWYKENKKAPAKKDKLQIAEEEFMEDIRAASDGNRDGQFVSEELAKRYSFFNKLENMFNKLPDDTINVELRGEDDMSAFIGQETSIVKPDYTKKPFIERVETPKRVYAGELPQGSKLPENTLSKKIIEKKKAEPIILGGKVETPTNIKQPTIAKRTPLKKVEQELPNLETKYVSGLKAEPKADTKIPTKFKSVEAELKSLTAEMKVTPPTETQIKRYKQLKAQVKPTKIPTREPVSTVEPVKPTKPTLTPKPKNVASNMAKTDNVYFDTISNATEKTKAEKRLSEPITFVDNKGNITKATRKEYIEDIAMIDGSQIKTTQKLRTNGGTTFEVNEYRVYKTPNSKDPIKISKYENDYFEFVKKNSDNVTQSVTPNEKSVQEVMKNLPEDVRAEYKKFEDGTFDGDAGGDIGLAEFADKITNKHIRKSIDIERILDYALGKDTKARKLVTEKWSKPFAESKDAYVKGYKQEMSGMEKTVVKDLGIKKNSKENEAIQWIGEGKRVIKEGKGLRKSLKEVDYTLAELKKDFNYVMPNGKKAWENIIEADTYFRSRYNRYVSTINAALMKIYPNVEKNVAKIEKQIAKLTDPTETAKLKERITKETDPAKLKKLKTRLANRNNSTYIEEEIGRLRWEINQATNNKRLYPQKNYYRHIKELKGGLLGNIEGLRHGATDIDPMVVGKTINTKPNSKFSSILQSRKNGLNYKVDAIGGFEDYILQAEYKINIEPNISKLRGMVKELRVATTEKRNANNLIEALENLANELAGKTNPLDRTLSGILTDKGNRLFIQSTTKVMNKIKANAVLGNIGTMLVQPANFNNVVAYAKNPLDVGDGIILATKALAGDKNAKAILAKSTALAERYMRRDMRRLDTGTIKKLENTSVWLLEALDKAVADSAFITFYKQGIKKGLKEADAVFQADKLVKKSIGGRGIGEMPLSQNAQLTKNFVPFTVEVRNAVNVYKEMLFDMSKGAKTGNKELLASGALGLTELMAVSFLMNEMYEKVLGRRITIDYIDSTKDALSGEDKTPQDKMVDLFYSTLGETLSGLPAGQYIAGLAQSATGLDNYEMKEMFGDADPTRFGTGPMLFTTFGKPIAQAMRGQKVDVISPALSILPKFGGRQIDRTLEGAKNMALLPNKGKMQDFPASYSATDKLRFTIEKTPENYVKALTTGIWSTDEGKNYIKNERTPLGSNQEAAVVNLGGTTEAEEFVRGFPKTGVDAQREMIFNSDFTPAQKSMLDKTLINSPVETKYRTKTDYEFSLLPQTTQQKFLIAASAGVSKKVYMDIMNNANLDGENSIKQDEIETYLEGFPDLTKKQKAAIWKSINSGWSAKNNPYI